MVRGFWTEPPGLSRRRTSLGRLPVQRHGVHHGQQAVVLLLVTAPHGGADLEVTTCALAGALDGLPAGTPAASLSTTDLHPVPRTDRRGPEYVPVPRRQRLVDVGGPSPSCPRCRWTAAGRDQQGRSQPDDAQRRGDATCLRDSRCPGLLRCPANRSDLTAETRLNGRAVGLCCTGITALAPPGRLDCYGQQVGGTRGLLPAVEGMRAWCRHGRC